MQYGSRSNIYFFIYNIYISVWDCVCHFMCLAIHHNFISAQGKAKEANLLKEEEESLSCLDSSTGCFELNLPILAAHVTSIILTILSSKFHHERIVETPLIVLKLMKNVMFTAMSYQRFTKWPPWKVETAWWKKRAFLVLTNSRGCKLRKSLGACLLLYLHEKRFQNILARYITNKMMYDRTLAVSGNYISDAWELFKVFFLHKIYISQTSVIENNKIQVLKYLNPEFQNFPGNNKGAPNFWITCVLVTRVFLDVKIPDFRVRNAPVSRRRIKLSELWNMI